MLKTPISDQYLENAYTELQHKGEILHRALRGNDMHGGAARLSERSELLNEQNSVVNAKTSNNASNTYNKGSELEAS